MVFFLDQELGYDATKIFSYGYGFRGCRKCHHIHLAISQDAPKQDGAAPSGGRPDGPPGGGRRGGFGGRQGGMAGLLATEEVQKELKLEDDQKKEISSLREEMMSRFRGGLAVLVDKVAHVVKAVLVALAAPRWTWRTRWVHSSKSRADEGNGQTHAEMRTEMENKISEILDPDQTDDFLD